MVAPLLCFGRHVAAVGLLVLTAACGGGDEPPPPPPKLTEAVVVQNGMISSSLAVRYEPLRTPRLAELARREQLESVVAGARDEWDKILRLKEWTAMQFPHSTPDPYPPWDAMTVLDWIRGGLTGGFCAQYSQVFLQSLASLGLQGRYVEIGLNDNPYAHYVMEVWSNQFNKWVVVDIDYNMHFERRGIPMSALEVHQALVRSDLANVISVRGAFREGHDDPSRWPLELAELYYYLRVHLKANHLSAPDEPPIDRFNDMVEYTDYDTVPWEFSQVASSYPKEPITKLRSGDPNVFDAKLNQTVLVAKLEESKVAISLDQNVFDFSHFEYRKLPRSGSAEDDDWVAIEENSLTWSPNPDQTRLEVRGVNVLGVPGPAAAVEARFQ